MRKKSQLERKKYDYRIERNLEKGMQNKLIVFNRALEWIKRNTINGNGITVTSAQQLVYPEVTGYYIPTLLEWGGERTGSFLCPVFVQNSETKWVLV